MNERVQTSLRFVGDWPAWAGITAAVVLGAAAFLLYRRDVRAPGALRWVLPTLRALAIAMIILMLSGPVLHHRKTIGQLSNLRLFVDGSRSMELTDSSMSLGRKVTILQRMGLLAEGAVKMELPQAGELLADAQLIAERARLAPDPSAEDWKKTSSEFAAKVGAARDLIAAGAGDGDRLPRFGKELYDPAAELSARELKQIDDRKRAVQDLGRLGEAARRWQNELADLFQKSAAELAAAEGSPLRSALQKFDATPRWQRLQSMLLEGAPKPLLGQFAEIHEVQLLELNGSEAKKVWQPGRKDSALPTALPKPDGEVTNLASGIKSDTEAQENEQRGAVVIFSDGQHNEGESPLEVAKVLAARQVPIYTVGIGTEKRPRDLAILKVDGPDSVFHQDRVRGEITIKDDMAVGQPFKVSISDGDKVVWEQQLITEDKQLRKIPFNFAVAELVQGRLATQNDANVQVSGLPLALSVSVSQIDGDREPANNGGGLRFRAVTQKRKVLLVDGRPRWETRYLRNLYERDEQWEVNAVIAGTSANEPGIVRGDKAGAFPSEPALLATYDLMVFGEVPPATWKGEELTWIRDFVAQRGGAIIFIDGPRGILKNYAETALAPLFPVEWKAAAHRENITHIALTERSAALAPFILAPERTQNAELWHSFQPPHWLSGATPLPGAETLLEAEVGGQKVPAAVYRSFGAGKVLYHGFDDSWRWRYEVADQHHVKYWNQAANWIAELPFAVRDKFVSLDTGAITYQPGDSADIRVRLRDGEGRPVTNATVDAVLMRDGKKAATIRLSADDNAGGLFRGKTAALEPGEYEIGIETPAIADRDLRARTAFKVEPRATGELTLLNVNEDLLKQVAAASGGEYFREENVRKLIDALAPMSQGKIVESDTVLWQSYWWFIPLVLLLTIEWIVRKRVGML